MLEPTDQLVGLEEKNVGIFTQWRSSRKGSASEQEKSEKQPAVQSVRKSEKTKKPSSSALRRWLTGLGALIVATAVFIGVVFYSPWLAVRTVTVEGAHLLSEDYVQSQLEQLHGVPLSRVDDQRVMELLGENSVLNGVVTESRPPHELVVRLQERVPVAVVEDRQNFYLVDAQGVQLGTVESVEDAGVPLIGGGLKATEEDSFRVLTKVLSSLPQSLMSEISKTTADSASTITLHMKDGTEVVWGTASDSEVKAKVLSSLIDSMGADGAVQVYDVSSPLHPTVK
ncbi:cell division protein FtsQ/DivIB [Rothia sp. ZJ1223]|uniref:cell division protein FtsQ/DivIB n=1 Tax=Rothia sp. ZJ1223 TaxID=2811098 RepID=UPI00195C0667|nr:cell division protein FtsQ/DivIB [Rothia sp. ZJ1223]MBM7050755.1 cell division protein FtsQ/DivIB [Rothia sp. ZJ1223]